MQESVIPQYAASGIAEFSCHDDDVELFIKQKAIEFEKRDKSRTYLMFSDEKTLLGYFTLSLKALLLSDTLSKRTIGDIDGFSRTATETGIILIGQFGKDKEKAKNVRGSDLFDKCIETVYEIYEAVGSRFVMIECKEIENVVSFYENNGFRKLQVSNDGKYLQMVRKL
jgi:hypothetical protein